MSTSTEHGHGLESAPNPDDSIAYREMSLELGRSLVARHAQAQWRGMPTVAHFIEVATLAPPTGSDEPGN